MALLNEVKKYYGRLSNYIGGSFVPSNSPDVLNVENPSTREIIGEVPLSLPEEVDAAIESAASAFKAWRETPPTVRQEYVKNLGDVILEHKEEIARIITQEMGKTIQEARDEVGRCIDMCRAALSVPRMMMGYGTEDVTTGLDEYCLKQPIGVFAMIAPYNFPGMVPYWFLPFALATGNTYIVKPSELVPITQTYMFELIHDKVKLPAGVLNMVHGSKEVANRLLTHPKVAGISFVGSSEVAKIVYTVASQHFKRVQCQGGAKNYIVVMPDCNLDDAISSLASSFYGCAGQRCLAGSVLVGVGKIYDELKERFVEFVKGYIVGYGLDESVNMGPVISEKHRNKILSLIDQAVKDGAKILLDGRNPQVKDGYDGYYIGPTVLEGVAPDSIVGKTEIFGPVASLMKVETLDEAIEIINAGDYGNGACIYTENAKAVRDFQYRVQAGNIGVNLGLPAPTGHFPFCGKKDSFFGTLHGQGQDVVDFFTDRKVVLARYFGLRKRFFA
ncbi:MAG: CoA-acylating methylmalonate-semialdehyde dehydrogenase [Syntrophothermus sp.]|uniref:CoA-acylating methylmalonate-semialdehyde dehydrogenase n=1 Tax=Syntrophothermus sp. TaxID=2736299 RepID=UPI00257C21E7|nr:CoA-acylating methylmalonate-semialdehyde dehydrogenase [Syntrophothermus sp.]NSW84135.1 CoA-acylating methylmalonate-semialdehyde dehydrogenase [Syntrophothermus sp.]